MARTKTPPIEDLESPIINKIISISIHLSDYYSELVAVIYTSAPPTDLQKKGNYSFYIYFKNSKKYSNQNLRNTANVA